MNEIDSLKERVAELTVERDALRESISQPATCECRLTYEELHAEYLVVCERLKKETKRAERVEYELKKRAAELEESHQDRQSWKTRKAIEQGNREREDLIGTENENLKKRVAELEGTIRGLLACHERLQSQLAWTPVSAGLPTEDGAGETYEFTADKRTVVHAHRGDNWYSVDGDILGDWEMVEDYTHYRRIELPKDGET